MTSPTRQLDELDFDNRFTDALAADPHPAPAVGERVLPRQVNGAAFSRVLPTPVAAPRTVAVAAEVAAMLDLGPDVTQSQEFAEVFAGNRVLAGMDPFAMAYGGHQFGNWAGQLGDGRAIGLGEVKNGRDEHLTLQLKGAGPTPYSRRADGRAVLRSSVREFLCSEAMHHLGVPTTRALSLVVTGDEVVRDMLYDGHPAPEPGAIVCRVAPSFIRFGNFELPASRGDLDLLRSLVDFTIRNDYPELGEPSPSVYAEWFAEVCRRTAVMIVDWMRVGFVHGVMNTDNMSILGLTIDYGPYGWLDDFDVDWTPNTTDAAGRRYRYGHQPQIAHWNLLRLANALYPLTEEAGPFEEALDSFVSEFQGGWIAAMGAKLGLVDAADDGTENGGPDIALVDGVQRSLQASEIDMTIFFRRLADVVTDGVDVAMLGTTAADARALIEPLADAFYPPAGAPDAPLESFLSDEVAVDVAGWVRTYIERVQADGRTDADRRAAMHAVNPKYVLRNYLAQLAIDDAEAGDYGLVNELLEVFRRPYEEQPEYERFAGRRPDWARERVGCSMLSCSS